jgi:hypothetical protein
VPTSCGTKPCAPKLFRIIPVPLHLDFFKLSLTPVDSSSSSSNLSDQKGAQRSAAVPLRLDLLKFSLTPVHRMNKMATLGPWWLHVDATRDHQRGTTAWSNSVPAADRLGCWLT